MRITNLSCVFNFSDIFHRSSLNKVSRQQALQKLSQLQQSISNWEGRDIASNSSEIVYEGKLQVLNKNLKTYAERYVFLLDGMILICKQQKQMDYRLREKFLIRRVDVIDSKEDSNQIDLRFVVINRDQSKVTFKAECSDDKRSWMAALVMLNTKSMLERTLDLYLGNDEKKYPLRFPPSDRYQFAEPNSSQNIVFEDREKTSGVPLIKGATLVKLVERLTYHVYADPMFMKTFLTTYRSFCTPNELLDLLIAVSFLLLLY
jgi:son of sevenless-like protein